MMKARLVFSAVVATTVALTALAPMAMAEGTSVQNMKMTPQMQQALQNINSMLGNPLGLPATTTTTETTTTTTTTEADAATDTAADATVDVETTEETTITTETTTEVDVDNAVDVATLSKDDLIAENKELQEEVTELKAAQEAEVSARRAVLNDQLIYLDEQLKLVQAKRDFVKGQLADLEEVTPAAQ